MWQILTPGFLLGMISSLHCVGMCGPLALSLPVRQPSRPERSGQSGHSGQWLGILTYHGGRIGTYALLGLFFGLAGRRIYIAGFQQAFSISLGTVMLLLVISKWLSSRSFSSRSLPSRSSRIPSLPRFPFLSRLPSLARLEGSLTRPLRQWIVRLWQSPSKSGVLLLGIANGLLPCGMVYLAIAAALSFPEVKEGVLFMALFGAGTLPALLVLHYSGHLISLGFRRQIQKTIPFFIAGMAVLLILRGCNLGIPYISPTLPTHPGQAIDCH